MTAKDDLDEARDAFLEKLAVCHADEFREAQEFLDALDWYRDDEA